MGQLSLHCEKLNHQFKRDICLLNFIDIFGVDKNIFGFFRPREDDRARDALVFEHVWRFEEIVEYLVVLLCKGTQKIDELKPCQSTKQPRSEAEER